VAGILQSHFRVLLHALAAGRIVPVLGAGVSLPDHPSDRRASLPTGAELARHLAERMGTDFKEGDDLPEVAQRVSDAYGTGLLYDELRRALAIDAQPGAVLRLLASLPERLRQKGYRSPNLLIVTTNYDMLMERALTDAGEPFEVLSYLTAENKFLHHKLSGDVRIIEVPNEYDEISLDRCSLVVKAYGGLEPRDSPRDDSFVITEDDYISYLTNSDLGLLMPVPLVARLRRSNLLFLGYSLSGWNTRVALHQLTGGRNPQYVSWAVISRAAESERAWWSRRSIEFIEMALGEYARVFEQALDGLPSYGRSA
jgi:hypothetical protein